MSATISTRKPVTKLTAVDLRTFPIWEYAIDEDLQDETWVRPVVGKNIRKGSYSQIVATDFITRSGRRLQGFMIVSTAGGKIEVTPGAIVGRVGYRVLPSASRKLAMARKYAWQLRDRDKLIDALRMQEADVFPLRYALRAQVRGENTLREGKVR